VQAPEQLGGAFEIGEQQRDLAARKLALRLQLRAEEPDGHDPVLLRGPQQPDARAIPRAVVLEGDLAEPRQRVAHVRGVVDREATCAARIDVGKGAVGERRTLLGRERCHAGMMAVSARTLGHSRRTPRHGDVV
jgi:hypothetical protein